MTTNRASVLFKDRNLGVAVVVAAQVLVGIIHVVFGFWLFSAGPDIYSVYTVIFSLLTLGLAVPLWMQKRWGWVGTVAVLAFVIVADSLTLLNLPSIPGIPKFAGFGEITYSVLVILYLSLSHIRTAYKIGSHKT
jgi:hypothetical protein